MSSKHRPSQPHQPADPTPVGGGLHSIAGFFKQLIQKESQALSESINRNLESLDESVDAADMDPALKDDLAKIMDKNHKLFIMLTHSPLLVNPESYIALYDQLETPLDAASKTLLIRRLLFHRQYERSWKICLETYTSLTDLEDFLDVAFLAFEENDNLSFGLLELLIACHTEEVNPGFRNHIIDICSLKYKISKDWIHKNLATWLELDNLQNIDDLVQFKTYNSIEDINVQMLYLKKVFEVIQNDPPNLSDLKDLITEHGDITRYPGWLSVMGPQFVHSSSFPYLKSSHTPPTATQLSKLATTSFESPSLNANDVMYILRSYPEYDPFTIYHAYNKNAKRTNRHIVNYLMNQVTVSGPIDQVNAILEAHFEILDDRPLITALTRVLLEVPVIFASSFTKLNLLSQERRDTIIPDFLDFALSSSISPEEIHILIKQLHFSYNYKGTRLALLKIAKSDYSKEEKIHIYDQLSSDDQILSKSMILELFRSMLLRSKINDARLNGLLFDKLLNASLKKEKILSRRRETDRSFHYDIQTLLYYATSKEKADFHNVIRAVGQTLSLIDPKEISKVLISFDSSLKSDQFTLLSSSYGKEYIMKSLMTELIRFLERSQEASQTILKIRDVMAGLSELQPPIASADAIQSSLFKLIVRDDPMKAVKLLEIYLDSKAKLSGNITHITLGILTSPKLDANQKIERLRDFLNRLKELGYKHKIRQSVIHQVVRIINDEKQNLSNDSKVWLFGILQEIKGTKRVIEKSMKQKRKSSAQKVKQNNQ